MNIQPKVSLPAVIDLSDDSSSRSKGHEDLNRDQERIENVNKANEIEQKSRSKFLRRKYSDVKLSSESWIDEDELYNP